MNQTTSLSIIKALADGTRLNVVRKLAILDKPVPSCDIVCSCATFLKLSQPAMSHHFTRLVAAGIIREHKQGTQKTYELNSELLLSVGIDAKKL